MYSLSCFFPAQYDSYPINGTVASLIPLSSDESLTSATTQLINNFTDSVISAREQISNTTENSTFVSLYNTVDNITSIENGYNYSVSLLYSTDSIHQFENSTTYVQDELTPSNLTHISITDPENASNVTFTNDFDYTDIPNGTTALVYDNKLETNIQNSTSIFSSFYDYDTTDIQDKYSNISTLFDNVSLFNVNVTFSTTAKPIEYSEHTAFDDQDFNSTFVTNHESTIYDTSYSTAVFSEDTDISDLTTFTDSDDRTTLSNDLTTKFEKTLILDDICRLNPDKCSWENSYDIDKTDSSLPQALWKKTLSSFSVGNTSLDKRPAGSDSVVYIVEYKPQCLNRVCKVKLKHTKTINIKTNGCLKFSIWARGNLRNSQFWIEELSIKNGREEISIREIGLSLMFKNKTDWIHIQHEIKKNIFPQKTLMLKVRITFKDPLIDSFAISNLKLDLTKECMDKSALLTTQHYRHNETSTTKWSRFPYYTTINNYGRQRIENRSTTVQRRLTLRSFDEIEEGSGSTTNIFPTEYATTNDESSAMIMINNTLHTTDDFSLYTNIIDSNSSEISTMSGTNIELTSTIQDELVVTDSSEIKTSRSTVAYKKSYHRSSSLLIFPLEMNIAKRFIIIISTLCLSLVCCTTLCAICALCRRRTAVWNVRFDSPIQLIRKISLHSLPLKQISRQASTIVRPKSTVLKAVSSIYSKDISSRYKPTDTPSSSMSTSSQMSKLSDNSAASYYTYL
ncbi:unnamed protein product [Didymodactylos carnosus]|uniref:Uncharacterized protein n=1 Tax=Didymodactylos carnosus TaxID=1234261 RepID=A0A8S2HAC2_9BILA|nr:unnamed protein product [Didymodactylos carnosus]CAF3620990.1 unnamed protein product [Didymodactylos carnosus]